ncbi:MAG: putative secreted protein [Candidatus Phytoplasma cynodontis]|nr:MAG: putative secreted protein [Candidatus Phytoplasma cynodontis]
MLMKLVIRKIFKWTIRLLLFLIFIFILYANYRGYKEFYTASEIPVPQVQEKKRWQELKGQSPTTMIQKHYTFYGLNGFNYYQKELLKEQAKSTTEQNPALISLYQQRISNQKEPSDLLFVQKPFKDWDAAILLGKEHYFGGHCFHKNDDSLIYYNIYPFNVNEERYEITFDFKGPKYLLDEDKDYYIGDASLPYSPEQKRVWVGLYPRKECHLHFNPVRNTLSVYTEKFNTQ